MERPVDGALLPPAAFVAEVEERAGELVRAADVLHLNGADYQGAGEGVQTAYVPGGMFLYLTVVRHQCIYVLQVTAWPS
ncbi:hypothetical protein EOT10_25345 [Streptomyces antnestii]|uniref:Uncharacterized protein n=1 Tax=Streptomyces antnestii TaxID=2494256 RepID=A0A437PGF9_9ACTN|nr:hypothetical protein EOT10_25345 [Streptomyces sp. San01]